MVGEITGRSSIRNAKSHIYMELFICPNHREIKQRKMNPEITVLPSEIETAN